MNQFIKTRNMFENAIGVKYPLTYEGWLAVRDDLKAAALYVNFFDEIKLAWSKAKSDFTSDEDGVSVVMQYLIKNVPIIIDESKRYNPKYIYRIAYNCMGCLRRVKRESDHYNLTTSNYISDCQGEESDLFATMIGDDSDMLETTYKRRYDIEIQQIIDNLDENAKKVIEYMLGSKTLSKRIESNREDVVTYLRAKFAKYRTTYCNHQPDDTLRFGRVLEIDDNVASAVVEMIDGTKVVYYGEIRVFPNGAEKVVFFGSNHDYLVPIKLAKHLKVLNVELY